MKSFDQASYLAQVRRLKQLARNALRQYSIQVRSVDFIHHGENTTFKVTARNGNKFLLRVHRNDYHSKAAIIEELKWLDRLAKEPTLITPRPVKTRSGELIATARASGVPDSRFCCMFRWIEGTFIEKSVSPKHMFEIGRLIADLQKAAPKTKHRRYWTADGLVGTSPKFGSLDQLRGVSVVHQRTITKARRRVWRRLKTFERKFPQRQGLIHADVHFGNILNLKGKLGVIDFDDSGFGFHAYDLAIPLISVGYSLGVKGRKRLPELRRALLSGYSSRTHWDKHDDVILDQLIMARRLLMLGWLNSRSNNPRLKKFLKVAVRRILKHIRNSP